MYRWWLYFGIKMGWVSSPYCQTHDGGVWNDEELAEWEEGGDPCAVVMRVLD